MNHIKVHRYANQKEIGFQGWIEPADRNWIAFVGIDGKPLVYLHRDPKTGAVE